MHENLCTFVHTAILIIVYVSSYYASVRANNDLAKAILNCSINQSSNIYQTT